MKEIMKRAHELAKAMEGDYQARLALALRQAWKEARKPVSFAADYGYHKNWLAKIVGPHPKFKLDREFVQPVHRERSYSGKTGTDRYAVTEDGIYELASNNNRRYFIVENGTRSEIEFEEVFAHVG